MSLRQRIEAVPEFARLPPEQYKQVAHAIVRYMVELGSATELRKLGQELEVREALASFKADFLDQAVFATKFYWRAFREYHMGASVEALAKTYGVSQDDLSFADEHLNAIEIATALAKLQKYKLPLLSVEVQARLLKQLKPYFRKLAYRLRFIFRYDGAYEQQDFESELQIEAIRVLAQYECTHETELHLFNATRRSLYNHWKRLITYHTAQRRRRLLSIGSSKEEYAASVLSLDYAPLSRDGESENMHGRLASTIQTPENKFGDVEFLDKLTKEIEPRFVLYVDIVLGEELPQQFVEWVLKVANRHPTNLSTKKIHLYAQTWLEITDEELEELGMLVQERTAKEA